MITRHTHWTSILTALGYLILVLGAAAMLIPFWWMIVTSLKPAGTEFSYPPQLWPTIIDGSSYTRIFTLVPFGRYFFNTILVTALIVVGQLVICSMAAYGFARLHFMGRDTIFLLYLATMMIPFQVTMIPSYLIVFRLGWVNTYWGLVVPGIVSAFGIFLLRQALLGIPNDLQDAARIDGAGEFRIYAVIMLPLIGPALTTLAVFAFMGAWTDLLWPLLIARSQEMRTLELGLAYFNAKSSAFQQTNWPMMMAAAVIVMLPVIVVFVLAQRYFVSGIAVSGLKE